MQRYIKTFWLSLLLLLSQFSHALIDPSLPYQVTRTQHFAVYHQPKQKQLANTIANYAEAIYPKLQKQLNWTPTDTTHIVLDDGNDFANGFANVLFQNHITLFLTPPLTINTLENTNNFLYTLIEHELVHTFHLEKNKGAPKLLKNIIGRSIFSYPNFFNTGWIIEGLATYYETNPQQNRGRGVSSSYDNLFRDEYLRGFKPFEQISLNIRTLPGGTTRYLYGVFFIDYLAKTYGKQKITQWVENYSGNIIPFQIHNNAKDVFGKDLFSLYDDFIQAKSAFYQQQIKRLKQQPLSKTEQLIDTPIAPNFVANKNQLFAIRTDYQSAPQLITIDNNHHVKPLTILRKATLNQATNKHVIITKRDNCNEYTERYDIFLYNINNKKLTAITQCGRYPYAIQLKNKNFIAVQLDSGKTQLVLLNNKGQLLQTLTHPDNTRRFARMALSPKGDYFAINTFNKKTGWQIERYHLKNKTWTSLTNNLYSHFNPAFTNNGQLLYNANNNGVYNIYKNKKAQSHLVLAGLNPVEFKQHIVFSAYKEGQFYLTKLLKTAKTVDPLPQIQVDFADNKTPANPSFIPFTPVSNTKIVSTKPYNALTTLKPYLWLPAFSTGNGLNQLGITLYGKDVLERHQYQASLLYESNYQKFLGTLQYRYRHYWVLTAQRLLNTITVSNNLYLRKLDSISVNYSLLNPRINASNNWYFGGSFSAESDEEKASNAPSLISIDSQSLGLGFIHNSVKDYLLSYNTNEGDMLRIAIENTTQSNLSTPTTKTSIDWRHFLSLKNQQVLASRLVLAASKNNNIYSLGGSNSSSSLSIFSGTLVEPLFGRTSFPLRGYNNTGFASALAVATLEWRIPINRPEASLNLIPLASMQNSYNLFIDTGALINTGITPQIKTGIGAELISDTALLYQVPLQLRIGYAYGLNTGGSGQFYFNLQQQF